MASKLLEALKNSTQADLDEIDKRLAEVEAEGDTLREARKLMHRKLGIETTKKRGSATDRGERQARTRDMRLAIAKILLANPNVPGRKAPITEKLGLGDGEYEHLTKHEFFTLTPDGIKLTTAGQLAARK